MNRTVRAAGGRVLLTWTLVCLAPQTGPAAGVLAAIEPPFVSEATDARVFYLDNLRADVKP